MQRAFAAISEGCERSRINRGGRLYRAARGIEEDNMYIENEKKKLRNKRGRRYYVCSLRINSGDDDNEKIMYKHFL